MLLLIFKFQIKNRARELCYGQVEGDIHDYDDPLAIHVVEKPSSNDAYRDWFEDDEGEEDNPSDEIDLYVAEPNPPKTPNFDLLLWWRERVSESEKRVYEYE